MTDTKTLEHTLTRIPKGCWRNVYYASAERYCGSHKRMVGPGRVIGSKDFVSKELAEEAFRRFGRVRPDDRYLGAEFFPE